jgi:hypothetical protein
MNSGGVVTKDEAAYLKKITAAELGNLGLNVYVYIRPRQHERSIVWEIRAADGTQMAQVSSREMAFAASAQHELEPLSVH